jgi:GT2 family glycosyltransferase/membrane protein implicated in regulation of membrane protease activity
MATSQANIVSLDAERTAARPQPVHGLPSAAARPRTAGKFLLCGDEKLWIKGVTYGAFEPTAEGVAFPAPARVDEDFAAMTANGLNTLRTYTVPPIWLLDAAARHGLRVMVGIPWEQHVAFLDDAATRRRIERTVRDGVRRCARHAAVLWYTLGNEIPPTIVRWHGRRRVERFIRRLYEIGKREDPEALFTYVNFPTTEYLRLPFLDIACFNVYLETPDSLSAYLARLQNLAGDKPLVMAEIGLDSRSNGVEAQAVSLAWQIRTAFESACAGAFVFAWTDEWHRGGYAIEDWDFGLTRRDRTPKPALAAICEAFTDAPFARGRQWPLTSVVVCSYNGSATIRDTLEALAVLEYPNYEVIVINDGSTDATPQIAAEYDVRLISTENRGLSNARNTGWQAARGEIVAYIDDDAYPDRHWLHYLAHTFATTDHVGVGGPNIAPPGDGPIADCIANAPGGPVHVLLTDTVAEHIPGCNMAFRRDALVAIDGFDPRYRAAGDDVDLCWRLQARGWTIGFNAGAMDWHHRRNSIRAYWKQQRGYGKAEALLEEKWPDRYNALGHYPWSGRLYGKGLTQALRARAGRIYQGQWGQALFQSLYEPAPGPLSSLPLMPEWFLLTGILAALAVLGLSWPPLLAVVPLLVLAIAAPVAQAALSAARAEFPTERPANERRKLKAVTALLHVMQPIARLCGRLSHGLSPWRARGETAGGASRLSWTGELWSERWRAADAWLDALTASARERRAVVRHGGDFDRWDLECIGGALGGARLLLAIEEHGKGRQMVRVRTRPRPAPLAAVAIALSGALAIAAMAQGGGLAAAVLGLAGAALAYGAWRQCGAAAATLARAVEALRREATAAQTKPAAAPREDS